MDAHLLRTECERIERLGDGPASEEARKEVERALESKWEGVQVTAARALSKWGDRRSVEAIRMLMAQLAKKSARWSAVGAVVDALRPHLSATDIDWVLSLCLKESNRHNRSTLMTLLLGLPPRETRAALQRMAGAGGCDPAEVRNAQQLLDMREQSAAAQQTAARDRVRNAAREQVALGVGMMDRVLRALFGRRVPVQSANEEQLLNYALDLAQEWGPQWMKPIQGRLKNAYPAMSETELNRLDDLARAAMNAGHGLVYSMAEKLGRDNVHRVQWQSEYSAQYPWVDEKNLSHLFSTGMYYAMKDLG